MKPPKISCSTFDVDRNVPQKYVLDTFKLARPQAAVKDKFISDALRYMDRAAKSGDFSLALTMAGALEKFLGTSAADTKREVRARVTEYGLAQKLQTARCRNFRVRRGRGARCRFQQRRRHGRGTLSIASRSATGSKV